MADFCGVNPQVSSRPRGVVLSIALHVFSAPELSGRALDFGGSDRRLTLPLFLWRAKVGASALWDHYARQTGGGGLKSFIAEFKEPLRSLSKLLTFSTCKRNS